MKLAGALLAGLGAAGLAAAKPVQIDAISADVSRYCSPKTNICYNEWKSTTFNMALRVGLPSTASTSAPFDTAVQIVAPRNYGWAGVAWMGTMIDSPLTIGWLNGNNITLSSRVALQYQLPSPWDGAKYRILGDQGTNTTHWTLSALCSGCSQYMTFKVNPNTSQGYLAVAVNTEINSVASRNNPNSTFNIHTSMGRFAFDFTAAKSSVFPAARRRSASPDFVDIDDDFAAALRAP